jgi:hypothetical protein
MTAFDKHGMLGGFARDNMACKSGTFPNCNSNTLVWDFDAGAGSVSNDGIGAFSKYELLMMGLYSAADLASEAPLVYCNGASQEYGTGQVEITCNSIDQKTPAEVEAALSSSTKQTQISQGTTLRYAALVLFPDASSATTEAQSASFTAGSDLEWLNTYIADTPQRFNSATLSRANINFMVTEADKRSTTGTAGSTGSDTNSDTGSSTNSNTGSGSTNSNNGGNTGSTNSNNGGSTGTDSDSGTGSNSSNTSGPPSPPPAQGTASNSGNPYSFLPAVVVTASGISAMIISA